MRHRTLCAPTLFALLTVSVGCFETSTPPTARANATHDTPARRETQAPVNSKDQQGATRQHVPATEQTKKPPSFKDLPTPSPETMKALADVPDHATSITTYDRRADIPPLILEMARGRSSARTETEDGVLTLGPARFERSLIGEDFYKANIRWTAHTGELLWERKFRLAPGCGGGWNLATIIARDRVYLWTIRTRDATRYVANVPIPIGPGPCKVTLVLTMLDKATGETIDGARIEGIHTPDKVALVEPDLLAIHETWSHRPGNICDDDPCIQQIERARFLDARNLARTHYFEKITPWE